MTDLRGAREILCDLDGTLVDSRQGPAKRAFAVAAIRSVAVEHGLWRAMRAVSSGRRALDEADAADPLTTNEQRVVKAFARGLGTDDLDKAKRALDTCLDATYPLLAPFFSPLPEATKFLRWLRGRLPITLATNPVAAQRFAVMRLGWAGIDAGVFAAVTGMESMRSCKPAPRYFLDVLAARGLTPSATVLVGNDPRKDLPATDVGIPVFLVDPRRSDVWVEPLPERRGAPAWRGSFAGLRTLLAREGA